MELHEALRRRAMVRSFSAEPVGRDTVGRILDAALRAPTAGNTGGTAWVALMGPTETGIYWSATTDEPWLTRNAERAAGLGRAPVVLLAYSFPDAYVARYGEPDKAVSGLGTGPDAWPVPYWHGDAAFGVMTVLLAAVDAGLGACVLGAFRGEAALAAALGVPPRWRLFCAVALGRPDRADRLSPSLTRPRPASTERIHWARWR
jgi:nitroreductase